MCVSSSNNDDLFVTNIAYTDLTGSNYRSGILVNDEIIVYDQNVFNRGNCDQGEVMKINVNDGSVRNTTYTVIINSMPTAGAPVYYDGTHLWLKPRCSYDNTLVSTTTTTTKQYDPTIFNNGDSFSYANVSGVESLYFFSNNEGEVYSYNINTAVKSSLNLKDQLQQQYISFWQVMTVVGNSLLWQPGDGDSAPFKAFDLITRQFSTLASNDFNSISSDTACFSCSNAFFASSGSKVVYATRPSNPFTGLRTGLAFVTLSASRPITVLETSATITTPTNLYNRASGYYYSLSPSGSFSFYRGIFKSDIAIDCSSGYFSQVSDFRILLGSQYTYFAKSSAPNTFTIDKSKYGIVPASKLPRCLSPTRSTLVSFTDLHTNTNNNNYYFAYSSKKSNKILLLGHNSDGNTIYNVASNTVSPFTLTPPPPPSSSQSGMPGMPGMSSGQFYYPISKNTEFDYWLYQDYFAGKCKLVSSTNATDVITLTSGNTSKYYQYY